MPDKIKKVFNHKEFLATLTKRSGVYRMMDGKGKIIYVGKARNLKNRVASYFRASGLATKTMKMVEKIEDIEITVTESETEALILEQSLIKNYRPTYNIQMRDDRSYPYILLTDKQEYPRLSLYRGSKKRAGTYFGPYPNAHSTRETLHLLHKIFRLRQCEDSYFDNRTRACLQHQIKRCSAPCVGSITPDSYARDVRHSVLFLEGKNNTITKELTQLMDEASEDQDFEKAAEYRDQIINLRRVQEEQFVEKQGKDADIIAAELKQSFVSIHIIYVRAGRVIGSKGFYPKFKLAESSADVLSAFISQNYLESEKSKHIPEEIIVGDVLEDGASIENALSHLANRKIKLSMRVRGHRSKWVKLARINARLSLQAQINDKQNIKSRFIELQESLKLNEEILRLECFDISHTSGERAVGACVVFDDSGAVKSDYRRFNIVDVQPGDDYGAMEHVLDRRFMRLSQGEGKIPDILVVDGGKGQLSQARKVLEKFQLQQIFLVGIAKGVSRRAGQETIFVTTATGYKEIVLPANSSALHLLQQIRDEAHRFAITGHRKRREKARKHSILEQIPGLGPKRRRDLLKHFGGHEELRKASLAELLKVSGISNKLAENIYSWFHPD
jgi:excinuclease ABC subunit C